MTRIDYNKRQKEIELGMAKKQAMNLLCTWINKTHEHVNIDKIKKKYDIFVENIYTWNLELNKKLL